MPWDVQFSDSEASDGAELPLGEAVAAEQPPAIGDALATPRRLGRPPPLASEQKRRLRAPGAGRPPGSTGQHVLRGVLAESRQAPADPQPPRGTAAAAAIAREGKGRARAGLAENNQIAVVSSLAARTGLQCLVLSALQPSALRPKPLKVATEALKITRNFELAPLHAPLCVQSLFFSTSRVTIHKKQIALASLLFACNLMVFDAFFKWLFVQLDAGVLVGVMCMVYIMADETPTMCKVAFASSTSGEPTGPSGSSALALAKLAARTGKPKKPSTAKVLQIEMHFVILLTGQLVHDAMTLLHGEFIVPLMSLDKATSETVDAAIDRATHIPSYVCLKRFFKLFLRAVTSDAAAYMRRWRRALRRVYREATLLETDCDIHTWNNGIHCGLKALDHDISGCLAIAQANHDSGSAETLRSSLAHSIARHLTVLRTSPAPSSHSPALRHRDMVLDTLISDTPPDEKRKAILRHYFNGGFLVYHGPESENTVAAATAEALYPQAFDMWSRSRWVKTLHPLKQVALLFNCGAGVGEEACENWLRRSLETEQARPHLESHLRGDPAEEAPPQTHTSWAEANKQARVDANEYIHSKPGPRLWILICSTQPAVWSMDSLLLHGSSKWRQQQMATFVEHPEKMPETQTVQAAAGSFAGRFFERMRTRMAADPCWEALPEHTRTCAVASSSFAVQARLVVWMHTKFWTKSIRYPEKLWLLLLPAFVALGIAQDILDEAWCLKCDFTIAFLTVYHTVALLTSEECRAVLWALALWLRRDTFPLECRFGWLRKFRGLTKFTHEKELSANSAVFFINRSRLHEASLKAILHDGDGETVAKHEAVASSTKPRRGGGGPWRAWVSHLLRRSTTHKRDFARASALYHDIKLAQGPLWEELVRRGECATEAHRAGGRSFRQGDTASVPPGAASILQAMLRGQRSAQEAISSAPEREATSATAALAEVLQAMDKRAREKADAGKREEDTESAAIGKWSHAPAAKSCFSMVPFAVGPVPLHPSIRMGELAFSSIDLVRQALRGAKQNLFPKLEAHWRTLHQVVEHSKCKQIPKTLKPCRSELCRKALMCLCTRKELKDFVHSWRACMRKSLQLGGPLRENYDRGGLLLRFWQRGDTSPKWVAMPTINLTEMDGSLMTLSYEPESARQRCAHSNNLEAVSVDLENSELGCTPMYFFFDNFRHDAPCDLRAYEACLDDTPTLDGNVIPGEVLAKALPWEKRFWHGKEKQRIAVQDRKRRRASDRAIVPRVAGVRVSLPRRHDTSPLALRDASSSDDTASEQDTDSNVSSGKVSSGDVSSGDVSSGDVSDSSFGSHEGLTPPPGPPGPGPIDELLKFMVAEVPDPPVDPPVPASSTSSSSSSDSSDSSAQESSSAVEEALAPPPRLPPGYHYIAVCGGHLVYSEKQINAHCGNPVHGRCHFDKSTRESASRNRGGQGRPLGALALWLYCSDVATREEHQDLKCWVCAPAQQRERAWHRERLHEQLDAAPLFDEQIERAKRDDSDSEPEQIPM